MQEKIMPSQYEIERIQLITVVMYGVFDGTRESVSYLMRDVAMFYEVYSDVMEDAEQVVICGKDSDSEAINALAMVALGFKGLDQIINSNDAKLYEVAKAVIDSIDIEKEFSEKMRKHVMNEMQLRAA